MQGRILLIGLAFLVGCAECPEPTPSKPDQQRIPLAQAFDAAATGTIQGRVVWDGDVPVAKETVERIIAYNPKLHQNPARFKTPHIPNVNAKTGGVADAIVFIKEIEPRRSKPWDHAKVRVEFHERQLRVQQGDARTGVGFVRRGDVVEIANRDKEYHLLRARGAAFLAIPLSGLEKTYQRVLPETGLVELTCAAGYYWLHAHLFVTDHPYFVRTDRDGRFVLDRVPAGEYEVVCWLPNWRVERVERDPEVADVARWIWATPRTQTKRIVVESGSKGELNYTWNNQGN